jgi:hypothetical protein
MKYLLPGLGNDSGALPRRGVKGCRQAEGGDFYWPWLA